MWGWGGERRVDNDDKLFLGDTTSCTSSLGGFPEPLPTRQRRNHCPHLWIRKPRPREVTQRAGDHTARNRVRIGTQVCEPFQVTPFTLQLSCPDSEPVPPPPHPYPTFLFPKRG